MILATCHLFHRLPQKLLRLHNLCRNALLGHLRILLTQTQPTIAIVATNVDLIVGRDEDGVQWSAVYTGNFGRGELGRRFDTFENVDAFR